MVGKENANSCAGKSLKGAARRILHERSGNAQTAQPVELADPVVNRAVTALKVAMELVDLVPDECRDDAIKAADAAHRTATAVLAEYESTLPLPGSGLSSSTSTSASTITSPFTAINGASNTPSTSSTASNAASIAVSTSNNSGASQTGRNQKHLPYEQSRQLTILLYRHLMEKPKTASALITILKSALPQVAAHYVKKDGFQRRIYDLLMFGRNHGRIVFADEHVGAFARTVKLTSKGRLYFWSIWTGRVRVKDGSKKTMMKLKLNNKA
ncbi:hypothetical protein BJ508DRAFT_339024 [Ascobolus immersus RN42]|uniref:Uncharacterized protein n=1 Tax=Ascobolus immersus RN42 TaxID=1160509 RepID=A0A3N4HS89_ASCIM|nr:hypothetical protein BJ508DRAFT_339024 [Ascobolus immersus RN42]